MPINTRLYLPEKDIWSLDSEALVEVSTEVPPEEEHLPKAGYPNLALSNKLMATLDSSTVMDIVENARAQRQSASPEDILAAFLYYYDNDAFIIF